MGNGTDAMKGKMKEATGKLVDDKDLEMEGKMQRTEAKAKAKLAAKVSDSL